MESSFPERTKLLGQTQKIQKKLPQILAFLQRVEEGFGAAANKKGILLEDFHIMYRQKALDPSSFACSQTEYRLGELLGSSYASAR
ncbi:MAG: hypothetical protein HFH30_14960 [Eubacterium sp.]|jgi:hypothetical protein|nr:hypothetical protein [Eubacterium sp.]